MSFPGRAAVKFLGVGITLALFVLAGCSEPAAGPTATEFNEKRTALKAKVAKKKGRKAPQDRGRKVAKGKPGKEGASGFAAVDGDFVYDPTGKRDPFRNFKWERPDRIRDRQVSGPLEQFDLSQLSLVAVVWKTGNARALIQDPSGESYIVAEGARIGKNEGYVTAIDDNMVRVKETYVDFLGRETTKDIELRMRRNEGG